METTKNKSTKTKRVKKLNIVIKSFNGIGDALFCTPTLPLIKEVYPQAHITINTNYPELFKHNPYVDVVGRKKEGVFLGYADPIHRKDPTCHHIEADYKIICDEYSLNLPPVRLKPEIYIPVTVERGGAGGVQVMHKEHWYGKKVWTKFNELAAYRDSGFRPIPQCKTITELVQAIARYKVIVCAEGGLSHIAKAVHTPAIVIYGGFASPKWNGYEDQINITNEKRCSYCYNPDKCTNDIDILCMAEITVEQVIRAVQGVQKLPELSVGNAKQFIEKDAKKWCKGNGLDIGCSSWPIDIGARGIDDKIEENAYTIKEENNSMDFVFSSHCLEHLENPHAAINEWVRVLKPNGLMYLYLPHPDYIPWRRISMSKWHKFDLTKELLLDFFSEQPLKIIEWVDKDYYFGKKIILKKTVVSG